MRFGVSNRWTALIFGSILFGDLGAETFFVDFWLVGGGDLLVLVDLTVAGDFPGLLGGDLPTVLGGDFTEPLGGVLGTGFGGVLPLLLDGVLLLLDGVLGEAGGVRLKLASEDV